MKQSFDKMFADYSEEDGNSWGINWRSSHYKRMKNIIDIMQPVLKKQHLKVLEAGCATGDMTKLVLECVKDLESYDAFDISKKAISICKGKKLDARCQWFVSDLINLQLNVKYDLIICCDVIYYLPIYQQKKCIENFYDNLEEKGHLLLCVPYDKKEVKSLTRFTKKFIMEYEKKEYLWLWCKIEFVLFKWYKQTRKGIIKKMLRAMIVSHILMEYFVWINKKMFPNKYSHMYMLLRKDKR